MKTRSELVARVQELDKVIEKMKSEKPLEQLRSYDYKYDYALAERQALKARIHFKNYKE